MGIGAYRHVVTLQDVDPAVVLDPPTWHCSVQSAAGQVIDGLAAYFIRGRFHPGITLETQILFEGRTLQVQSVNDVDERHQDLVLTCVEPVARGGNPGTTPTITTPPQDVTIAEGESATLTVVAAGTAPLVYQWTQAGVDLAGATSASYVTGPLTVTSVYAVRVSNIYSTVTSQPATVTVEPPPDYQETVLADGVIAYWPLDDPAGSLTVHDLAGTGAGTVHGSTVLGVPGPGAATAASFDSDNFGDYIGIPLTTIPMQASIELWFAWTRTTGQSMSLFSNKWSTDYAISITLSTGSVLFEVAQDSGGIASPPGVIINADGQWHHVVGVIDANASRVWLYMDGQTNFPDGVPVTRTHPSTQTQCTLGGNDDSTYSYLTGQMADAAIYPRALTPAEVTAHYSLRLGVLGRRR
jgi:hypothetical protein